MSVLVCHGKWDKGKAGEKGPEGEGNRGRAGGCGRQGGGSLELVDPGRERQWVSPGTTPGRRRPRVVRREPKGGEGESGTGGGESQGF